MLRLNESPSLSPSLDAFVQAAAEFADTVTQADQKNHYRLRSTLPSTRTAHSVLIPDSATALQKVLSLAQDYQVQLHVVSRGLNWAFGCMIPQNSNACAVSLERLRTISSFDDKLGLVEVEAGVSFGELSMFLATKEAKWFCDCPAAGPAVSVLGNALALGLGFHGDGLRIHQTLPRLVLLSNGEVARLPTKQASLLTNMISQYGWQVAKQHFQIVAVISAQIRLIRNFARKVVGLVDFDDTKSAAIGLEKLMQLKAVGILKSQPRVQDRIRILAGNARLVEYEREFRAREYATLAGTRFGVKEWTAAIPICVADADYGSVHEALRREFGSRGMRFEDWSASPQSKEKLGSLFGMPTEATLRLAYFRSEHPGPERDLHPTRDRCGIAMIWHRIIGGRATPIGTIENRVLRVDTILSKYIDSGSSVTLSRSLSVVSGFDLVLSVMLHYDLNLSSQRNRANALLTQLTRALADAGFPQLRVPVGYEYRSRNSFTQTSPSPYRRTLCSPD